MTAPRRDNCETPFSDWVRRHPLLSSAPNGAALSITDVDYVIHKYFVKDKATNETLGRQHLMLIELKTHEATLSRPAQKDTLHLLDQALGYSDRQQVEVMRGRKLSYYHGLHVLRLQNTTPANSEWMAWDDVKINTELLIRILRFEVNARTLREREDRSHHKKDPPLDPTWVTSEPNA